MASATIQIETYHFRPADLDISSRRPGISAFMRIRNGAFALEAAIRSHIGHFDEIVAVYNRCTDATPDILERLSLEFGPRLRVFHYQPPVFPPGSDGHRREPADSPLSLVNYYNFALSQTRFSHVTKLDDDHVAMGEATATLVADVRSGKAANREMACFSGLNLARDATGRLGILAREPMSGSGDIGIFPVGAKTFFTHDRRFEVLRTGGLPKRFHSFVYWHLKYLKPDFGFANYDLADNPASRYARRLAALESDRNVLGLADFASRADPSGTLAARLFAAHVPMPARSRIVLARGMTATRVFATNSLERLVAQDKELAGFVASMPDSVQAAGR